MPYKPGESGNPGGKPKVPVHVRELARAYTEDAVKALVKCLKVKGERVAAANTLLAYGYGKPATTVNLRVITSIADLSTEELEAIANASDDGLTIEGTADEADDEADDSADC